MSSGGEWEEQIPHYRCDICFKHDLENTGAYWCVLCGLDYWKCRFDKLPSCHWWTMQMVGVVCHSWLQNSTAGFFPSWLTITSLHQKSASRMNGCLGHSNCTKFLLERGHSATSLFGQVDFWHATSSLWGFRDLAKQGEIYLLEVGSSDELTYFLTYLYLFSNKCAKYKLRTFPIFLL